MANLIFDYDGTIHNSMKTYAPAFRQTYKWLVDNGLACEREYSDKEISYWLGFNSTDMWNMFLPELELSVREKCRKMLGRDMAQRIENGEGELYPHAEEILSELRSQGHTLIFLSNCRCHYMERHKRVFHLERFFDRFYCCEEFGFIPKSEIFPMIAPFFSGSFIALGDRFHDIEMAVKNNIMSVGCGYGYGSAEELSAANLIVDSLTEISGAVAELLRR